MARDILGAITVDGLPLYYGGAVFTLVHANAHVFGRRQLFLPVTTIRSAGCGG